MEPRILARVGCRSESGRYSIAGSWSGRWRKSAVIANIGAAPTLSGRFSRTVFAALPSNSHSFQTEALLGGRTCKPPEEHKAWSENLSQENVLTTFSSYGDVARHRQAEIIRALGRSEQRAGT
jgi:hypothetical protein